MDFICKDSPEKESSNANASMPTPDVVSPQQKSTTPNAAKLSALLNGSRDSDVEMDAENENEPMDEDENEDDDTRSTSDPANGVDRRVAAASSSSLPVVVEDSPANQTDEDISDKNGGLSDNEDSEDEQAEYAAWQDVDLNPAVDLVRCKWLEFVARILFPLIRMVLFFVCFPFQVNKVVRESLEAGKTYNKSITAKTTQASRLWRSSSRAFPPSRRHLTLCVIV